MQQIIKQLPNINDEENLKSTLEKSFLIPLTVKYLGREIGFEALKPVQSKTAVIH